LSVLGKKAFSENTILFANNLHQGFLELSKDPNQWNNVIARDGKDGTSLMILLYYHFHGTEEYEAIHFFNTIVLFIFFYNFDITFRNDMISLESLIARIMLLGAFAQIPDSILKPLWFLFAVSTYIYPLLIFFYINRVRFHR